MEKQLYPYQFNYIKERIAHLINVYNSVNDLNTIASIQETTREQMLNTFQSVDSSIQLEIEKLMNYQLSKMQAEKILSTLQDYVLPFEHPSKKQVDKVFRKVKKLKTPLISNEVLLESTFIGWNDVASNRKYIIYYNDFGKLDGFYGDISNQTVKGFCSICNKESRVTLFMRKTRTTSDGQYTKKGDYICFDSTVCNQQISDLSYFYRFLNKIQ
ncbi:FusB/FusC family EF-G-binding protein [Staphylococcus pseudoxylosus]|uniref:Elongation factor G-binding protein n=1 Tax=Staphylococcus pseudoxylosus TaxID=2282419 RepID=A0AAQ0MG53_9STAP|nr:FusB/FusC family EF-G-binding protein [Staphylococcus pseudoxylosus]RQM85173.1 elongation factor G-binding protein [Staphylococcus xylosus]MCE5001293.1 FusB/FusC family EF-G-binding protein [Staphylococcus pseudoxylosus]MDW8545917.1 FusB/FusC family EF-G-binding protein [Staphylococcus pseudoxylosus]MEB6170828.1 FusB/FusC family EF-G-binding protein [Staphylococcus pseudoxylosus]MEB6332435.1 FusB/FusC family EF-G-binding protein [Staphylococcus pseudoxylosus]